VVKENKNLIGFADNTFDIEMMEAFTARSKVVIKKVVLNDSSFENFLPLLL